MSDTLPYFANTGERPRLVHEYVDSSSPSPRNQKMKTLESDKSAATRLRTGRMKNVMKSKFLLDFSRCRYPAISLQSAEVRLDEKYLTISHLRNPY